MSIYLDYNANTPLAPQVLEAMLPYYSGIKGNPSSIHQQGRLVRGAIEQAREQVAALVQAHPSQVIFTASGTEANNLAIKGYAMAQAPAALAISATEHPSVIRAAESLTRWGWRIDYLPVATNGVLLSPTVAHDVKLVSIALANNENGVIQDIAAIAHSLKPQNLILHTDAVQALGKIPIHFTSLGVQMMTLSAHKIYGPLGAGALIIDRSIELIPQMLGGGQELGLRSGTENIAAIVGFGVAAQLAQQKLTERSMHLSKLRDYFEHGLQQLSAIIILNDQAPQRLANTTLFSLPGIDGEMLLMNLDKAGFAVSSGSACASGTGKPSHVLLAMQVPDSIAECSVRVSFGEENTLEEVEALLKFLQQQINQLN